jgi:hypothetical protein
MEFCCGYVFLGAGDVEVDRSDARRLLFLGGEWEVLVIAGRSPALIERDAGDAIKSELVLLKVVGGIDNAVLPCAVPRRLLKLEVYLKGFNYPCCYSRFRTAVPGTICTIRQWGFLWGLKRENHRNPEYR